MNASGFVANQAELDFMREWASRIGSEPSTPMPRIIRSTQGWGALQMDRSIIKEPLRLKGRVFETGFWTHTDGEIAIRSNSPLKTVSAIVGLDDSKGSGTHVSMFVSKDGSFASY